MPDNQFLRDASDRLTFTMFKLPADSYTPLCREIKERFGLTAVGERVAGLDVVFQNYRLGEQVVGLEWDNWSGFIVVAKHPQAEPLVQTIGSWLLSTIWAACGISDG
jgi:hypothetical protein